VHCNLLAIVFSIVEFYKWFEPLVQWRFWTTYLGIPGGLLLRHPSSVLLHPTSWRKRWGVRSIFLGTEQRRCTERYFLLSGLSEFESCAYKPYVVQPDSDGYDDTLVFRMFAIVPARFETFNFLPTSSSICDGFGTTVHIGHQCKGGTHLRHVLHCTRDATLLDVKHMRHRVPLVE
jgi:hypothetical protein